MKPTVSLTQKNYNNNEAHGDELFPSAQLILISFRFKVFTISEITKMLLSAGDGGGGGGSGCAAGC